MKRITITGVLVLAVLLVTPFLASSAAAGDVIRNGDFNENISQWIVNPDIDPTWNPLSNGAVSLHPPSDTWEGFMGTVIYQNLNVTGIASSIFSFSMDLLKTSTPGGNTILVILTYVDDSGNVNEVDLVNPDNATVSSDPGNITPVTADYTFPATARKLIKIEIEKDGWGDFTADNISLITTASVIAGAVPFVTGLSANSGAYGDSITISGGNFGDTQGFVSIESNSDGVNIQSWSDTSITATISEPARSGRVYVVADYVETNPDFSFNVTSPNFTITLLNDDLTVIKGQTVDLVLRVDFLNCFTTTNGISFFVPELQSGVSFLPASLTEPGGVVVRINTSNLTVGEHNLTVQSLEDASYARFTHFILEVLEVSEIKFVEYDDNVNPPKKTYITSKTVPYQGQFGEQFAAGDDLTRISYEVHCTDGSIMNNDVAGVTLTSLNTSMVGAYKRYWGYDLYALQNGTTTLRAQSPDGKTADLPVTVEIPTDAPQITSITLTPSSLTPSTGVSNKGTDTITFHATSNETTNRISSIGSNTSGYMNLTFGLLDNSQYNSDYTSVTSEFHITNPPADLGTAIVYASASKSGYDGSSTAALPLTTFNDSDYSGLHVAFKALDPSLFGEGFDIEFYAPDNMVTPAFTKEIWGMHLSMGTPISVGGIPPADYKLRFVPYGNIKSQWWPNTADPARAASLTFNAGAVVDNIFFFADSGSTVSGSVVMNDYSSGTIRIGAFMDQALTQLAGETEILVPGNFTVIGLEQGTYYMAAFLDINDNGEPDDGEPAATAGIFPVVVGEKNAADTGIINLGNNGGALSGTVELGEGITAVGTVYVGVFNDADMTQVASGAVLDASGVFTILNLPPGTYYVASYMDVGGNNPFPSEPGEEDPMVDASGNPVTVITGITADAGTITLTESSQADISFTGAVVDSENSPVASTTVEMADSPSLFTTTADYGTFTLAGLPVDTPFSLKIWKSGYVDIYSAMMQSDADVDGTTRPFSLFTSDEVSGWGVTSGKGVIKGRVRNQADGTSIIGATVTCVSAHGKNYTIVYVNEAGALDRSTTAISSKGKYFILNVEEGDQVCVTAQKAGWAFDGLVFMTHADSVSEGSIFGTTDTDKIVIHTRLMTAIDAYNAGDIDGFMACISEDYFDDGMNKIAFRTEVEEEMGDEQLSYMVLDTMVDGDTATTYIIWAYGETETLHFIKKNETWMLYGNQKKYEVEAWSHNWQNGTQYMVQFEVEDPNRTATSVTITGPGIVGSLSLDYDTDEGSWNSWHTNKSLDFGATPPTPPLEYKFTIMYGEPVATFTDTFTVRSFVSVVATDLSPSGTAANPLVFSWTGVGPGYAYQVELRDTDWNRVWDSDWRRTETSVSYDGPSLTPGVKYHYWVVVEDPYGNSSFAEGSFTQATAQGDVNDDTNVNLTDAILGLKVMTGMSPTEIRSNYATSGADANGDSKIGLTEAIYPLQHAGGLQ